MQKLKWFQISYVGKMIYCVARNLTEYAYDEDDHTTTNAVNFLLHSELKWRQLPEENFKGSGVNAASTN